MSNQIPVFDSWGNYIGYFTEETGCSSGIAVIILIIPLVTVFYLVNVFRIGAHLIKTSRYMKAILWFAAWLYPVFVQIYPYLIAAIIYILVFFFSPDTPLTSDLDVETLPLGLQLLMYPLTFSWLAVVCSMLPVSLTHLILAFKYSNLDF